jgi:hypothetical protein
LSNTQKNKDFWTHGAVFTSKDQNLNKAHVQHIEARLVGMAMTAKRCELDNANQPQPPTLSEADAADSEGFLADVLLCLPIVGIGMFETVKASGPKARELFLKAKGIEARGMDTPQGFVVRVGSRIVKTQVASIHTYLANLRNAMLQKGIFEDVGDAYRLTQDYTFASPSTAAGVLLGRAANGRVEWKDNKGRTLKEIQEDEAGGS